MLAIEPVYPGNESRMRPVHASLAPLVRALGIKLEPGVLEQDGEYALTARAFAVHPATDPLRRRRLFTLWEGAGPLSRRVDGDARSVSLVYGPARAPLLMASTLGQGRALVASDATWLSTLALEQQPGNAALATSTLSWVLQRSLPPRLAPVHRDRRVPARRPWWWVLWTWAMWPALLGVLGRRGRA